MAVSIKRKFRECVSTIPGGKKLVWLIDSLLFRVRRGVSKPEDIFSLYYRENAWGDPESVSGRGSTIENTENIRKELPVLLRKLGVRCMLDAPCGDFNWFRLVELPEGVRYLGGDIVEPMIVENQRKYGNALTSFSVINVIEDKLPDVDLWLCRDALNHLSNRDILKTLRNLLASNIRYFLVSTDPLCSRNEDIPTGSCRRLNLELPPFNFCKPVLEIDEIRQGALAGKLCLWEREALVQCLAGNRAMRSVTRAE